ncbi:MAG TPA: hypothetical protein VF756_10670 [Thermoanaerobaculia bacterium]
MRLSQRHLEPEVLGRLRSGEAAQAEVREIVRHLLAGCRECQAAVRPFWGGSDPSPRKEPCPR